jgi:hypothetical protein
VFRLAIVEFARHHRQNRGLSFFISESFSPGGRPAYCGRPFHWRRGYLNGTETKKRPRRYAPGPSSGSQMRTSGIK